MSKCLNCGSECLDIFDGHCLRCAEEKRTAQQKPGAIFSFAAGLCLGSVDKVQIPPWGKGAKKLMRRVEPPTMWLDRNDRSWQEDHLEDSGCVGICAQVGWREFKI